jgi:MFS transporter, YNFM family, putative membrane transport protein
VAPADGHAMRGGRWLVPVLGACAFASGFGIRIVDPIVPLLSAEFAVSLGATSLLVTVFSVSYALGQPVLGPLGDVIGKVRLIVLCGAIVAAMLVVCALSPGFVPLALVRGASGFIAGGIIPLAIALIGDSVGFEERQVALGRFLIASILGQTLGAAVSGFVSELWGWRAVFLLTGALMGAATAIAFSTLTLEPKRQEKFGTSAVFSRHGKILSDPRARLLYGLVILGGIAVYGIFPFVAMILAARLGTGAAEAGVVLAGFGMGGVLYALFVRQIIGFLGPSKMSLIGGIGSGIALALFALPLPWTWNVALFVVLGLAYFMIHNTLQTRATEFAPDSRASAVSLFAFCLFSAQGLGPLAIGGAISVVSVSVVVVILGVVIAAVGILAPRVLADRSDDDSKH